MGDSVVAALISAGTAIVTLFLKSVIDDVTKKDERAFRKALKAHDVSLEAQVKLFVDTQLKGHDARLRIAAEWRIKMLDKMLEAGGELRVRLNGIFAAIDELLREATLNGAAGETQSLVKKCDDARRAVTTVGGYLPPPLIEQARGLLDRSDEVVSDIVEWANKEHLDERNTACDATNLKIKALAEDMTKTFSAWHATMWGLQEEQLSLLASGDQAKVEAFLARPSPFLLPPETK
jgi:hypothetical protein